MELDVDIGKRNGSFHFAASFSLSSRRCGIFGPSGSGKSTLMHLLAGLQQPDSGTIRLAGRTLFDATAKVNVAPDKRCIGVVFQHAHLFPHMNVRRNLFYGWRRKPEASRHIDPDALIEVLGLGRLLDRSICQLSGGERQRVALGRTVLACPELILMDEPLTGLDQDLKYQIIPYLQKAFAEFAIPLLFISHSVREMRLMTDEVLVFRDGRLRDRMTAEELARSSMKTEGYINMLHLGRPRPSGELWAYRWGGAELILTEQGQGDDNIFELDAREIVLFKRHPEATSARNLLTCRVNALFGVNNRIGVELSCGGKTLVAQIVPEAVRELAVAPGTEVVAAIKASSFRQLI